MAALRPLCDIILSMFMSGYINALEAQINKSRARPDQPRPSTDGWNKALNKAKEAYTRSQEAWKLCKSGQGNEGDELAALALAELKSR